MLAPRSPRPINRAARPLAALAGLALAFATGCATETVTTADTAANSDETQALLDQYEQQLPVEREVRVSTGELRANVTPVTTAAGEIILDDIPDTTAPSAASQNSSFSQTASAVDLDDQIELTTTELAVMLAQRATRDEFGVGFGDLARMASLDAIIPGLFNTYFLDASAGTTLTEAQRDALTLWRTLTLDTVSEMEDSLDEEQLALYREIRKREQDWRKWAELSVSDTALCTAVYGYGHYDKMNTDDQGHHRLIAGRRYRAVVYVEVEGFSNSPTVREGAKGFETSVALSMSLYQHQSDDGTETDSSKGDLLTWKTTEESVKDFSRRQRNDFFLIQTIEFPETLSTGRYTLKVRVRDLANDRQTEKLVPIDIVTIRNAVNNNPR